MVRKGGVLIWSSPILPIITISEYIPKETEVWAPHQSPWTKGPALGRQAPSTFGLEGRPSLLALVPEGWRKQRLQSERAHTKISHTPRPRAEATIWYEPWSDLLADLGASPREAGGNWSSCWGKDTAGSHSGEPVLPWGHWCWKMPFWNTPSSLLMSGPSSLPPHPPVLGLLRPGN